MIEVRKANERGHFDHGWLDTWHTFSFADYYDPKHVHFRALRVMNEDRVDPGSGFGTHPHRDLEIVTYVLEGALAHRDSLGTGSVLAAGELQRITAGKGITHSEFNASPTEPVHLYQIWLLPERKGLEPEYEQRSFAEAEKREAWRLVASPTGREGSLRIHQDVTLWLTTLDPAEPRPYPLEPARHAWLQVLRGQVDCNGLTLSAGDGAAISDQAGLTVTGVLPSEVMLFDLG